MPPLALTSLLQHALPWLSADGRAAVNTLICTNGRVGSARALCARLGLRSRFQLSRLLHREGLPPYEELAGWICVLYWMLMADAGVGKGALRALAGQARIETASSYRLVRRVTGYCWKDLRRVGTAQVVRWFQQRTRSPRSVRSVAISRRSAVAPHAIPVPGSSTRVSSQSQPRRLALPGCPYGIAVRGSDLAYITRGHAAAIERLDLRSGELTGSIPVGCTPSCVTFDPTGERAYVSVQYLDAISVIDANRHVQIRTLPVPGDPFPLLMSRRSHTLFVATNEDRLFALSAQNGRVLGSLPLPATSHHLAWHPAGDRLYVATRAAGSVLEVDATRYIVLRSFALGGWPQGLVVSPDGTMLYVANEHHGLDVIGLGNGKRLATLENERGAVALALSPDERFLYTGMVHAGKVGIIERASLTRCGTLETGGRPGQIAFDAAGRVIVSNEAGWIDILPVGQLTPAAAVAMA